MSQCVPSWDLDNNHNNNNRFSHRSRSNLTSPDVPMLDYHEVAELTWENGQIAMHSLAGSPRVPAKTAVAAAAAATNSATKYTWEKPRASGTLESIVNQATSLPNCNPTLDGGCGGGSGGGGGNVLAPWFHQQRAAAAAAAAAATATVTVAMDALVPCSNRTSKDTPAHVIDTVMGRGIGGGGGGDGRTCVVDCSTLVGSCSGSPAATKEVNVIRKRARAARVTVAPECSGGGRDQSASGSGSATCERTHDTYNNDMADLVGVGFTSTSMGSPENTSSAKPCTKATTTADDHDSVSHCRPQREAGDEADKKKGTGKSSVSTKRSRAAAIHNQSERKRRDKINQRMKTLQKLVPNSSKTDKASMLDEVIEYLKQLQAQIQMMSRMNMPQMMLPMTMQQQLQMSMMAPMGMGMGMGMGVMDMMNAIARPNIPAVSPVITPPFMPVAASWDGSGGDRLQAPPATVLADPLSFLACQSQPMTMDAYSRMASLYQQLQQPPPASSSKS